MSALPGYITLVGHSNTLGVIEGLSTIPSLCISHSNANLYLNTPIEKIQFQEPNSFTLFFNSSFENFDIVILAAPIELSNLNFEGVKIPYKESREYQVTHATVVTGTLQNEFFQENSNIQLPGEILTVENSSLNFTSIA